MYSLSLVIAGLDPAISRDADGRGKPGHDGLSGECLHSLTVPTLDYACLKKRLALPHISFCCVSGLRLFQAR
ncbi:MAG TPA: hypothetical protein VFA12_16135, partial [Stellaceae bacterium]|nr:hypothetical protein [Stellaceae bacterium]